MVRNGTALLATGLLTMAIAAPAASGAPPANDSFAGATAVANPAIGSPITVTTQTTVDATAETNEPAHAGSPASRSVWYSFTPSQSGRYWAYICSVSTRIAVYTGTTVDGLTAVASASSGAGSCLTSTNLKFIAHAGNTYHVAIDHSNSSNWSFRLELQDLGAANDDFADAVALTSPASGVPTTLTDQTSVAATAETGEPAHAGFAPTNSVWYSFVPVATAQYAYYICSTSTRLAVYTGGALNALTEVASSATGGGSCSTTTALLFVGTAGTPYRLVVNPSAQTDFTVRLVFMDADLDGASDPFDNCPSVANAGQENSDGDAEGDECDMDDDNDGVLDTADGCRTQAGPGSNSGCPVPQTPSTTQVPLTTVPVPSFDLPGAIRNCKKKFRPGKLRKKCIRKAKARAQA